MMQRFWDSAMSIGPLDDDDDSRRLVCSCILLPPFQIIACFGFLLIQTSSTLTKFVEKCTNIYNIKLISLSSPLNVF
jgi:hypothetical protein